MKPIFLTTLLLLGGHAFAQSSPPKTAEAVAKALLALQPMACAPLAPTQKPHTWTLACVTEDDGRIAGTAVVATAVSPARYNILTLSVEFERPIPVSAFATETFKQAVENAAHEAMLRYAGVVRRRPAVSELGELALEQPYFLNSGVNGWLKIQSSEDRKKITIEIMLVG